MAAARGVTMSRRFTESNLFPTHLIKSSRDFLDARTATFLPVRRASATVSILIRVIGLAAHADRQADVCVRARPDPRREDCTHVRLHGKEVPVSFQHHGVRARRRRSGRKADAHGMPVVVQTDGIIRRFLNLPRMLVMPAGATVTPQPTPRGIATRWLVRRAAS